MGAEFEKIVSADDECPLCQTPIPHPSVDEHKLAGTWDGSLGLGCGFGPFAWDCRACGATLIGWQYTTCGPEGFPLIRRVRWDGTRAEPRTEDDRVR
jgi:hypothetical protein